MGQDGPPGNQSPDKERPSICSKRNGNWIGKTADCEDFRAPNFVSPTDSFQIQEKWKVPATSIWHLTAY